MNTSGVADSVSRSAAKVNAAVKKTTTSAGRTLIEMPLGTRDGLALNTKLYVYRSTGYVADAVIELPPPIPHDGHEEEGLHHLTAAGERQGRLGRIRR